MFTFFAVFAISAANPALGVNYRMEHEKNL